MGSVPWGKAAGACLANINVKECWLCAQGQLTCKVILLSIFLLRLPVLEISSPISLPGFFCCESQNFLSFFFFLGGGGADSVIHKGLGCLRVGGGGCWFCHTQRFRLSKSSVPPSSQLWLCHYLCLFKTNFLFQITRSHFLNHVTLRYLIYAR